MKKLIMSLLLTVTTVFATQSTNCERNPHECVGPQGPQGEQGEQGPIGETGATGTTGDTGATGEAGATGSSGIDGADGENGTDGESGMDGSDGTDGSDGVDGKVDYTNINRQIKNINERQSEANAGAMAVGAIDFGSVCDGETAIGLGAGVGDWGQERSYAVGAGVKHGLTDDTAAVFKGYYGVDGHASGAGVAVVHKF